MAIKKDSKWLSLLFIVSVIVTFYFNLAEAEYQCDGFTDTCNCYRVNPYPCCDNTGDGDYNDNNDGNCTWWAWHMMCCKWSWSDTNNAPGSWGNAKSWLSNAQAEGYPTGTEPKVGSVFVWTSGTYGHVGWVFKVDSDYVYTTEMQCGYPNQYTNENGSANVDQGYRRRSKADMASLTAGYIYPKGAGYASVSQGVTVSPDPVVLGQNFTVSFTLKEVNGAPKTFEQVAVAILRSDNSFVFDFAMYNNVTIPANGTWSQSPVNYLYTTNPPGTYKAMIRGKTPGGNWFDFDTTGSGVNPRSFTAIAQDTTPPTVSAFSVTPSSLILGNSFTISYTVSDSDGSGLNRVELWRAPDSDGTPGTWAKITQTSLSGNGPTSSSFSDAPSSTGTYWYGVHVLDNAENMSVEPNPPGPIKVTVSPSPVSITIATSPFGKQITVDGTNYTAPQTFNWVPGSTHTISTPSPQYSSDSKTKYNFSSWSDGGAQTHQITVPSSNTTYTTTFTTQYLLDTSVNPLGSGSIILNPSGSWYNPGQAVQLTATPNSGYTFSSWSGSISSTSNPVSITMDGPKSVTANFTLSPVSITISTSPSGRQITVDSSNYTAPQTFNWTLGSTHTICVSSPQSSGSGIQYVFSSWSDGGAQTHTITAPSSATSYTAYFTTQYQLTTSVNPSGAGSVNPNCSGGCWYNSGASVTLTATPNSGYTFSGWSGSISSTSNPVTITMDANKTVTANYSTVTHTLTVNSSNPSSGVSITVSPNDNNGYGNGTTQFTRTYNNGTSVTLTAPSTAGGNNFQKWQRNGVDWTTNLSTTVTMDADYTMTAVYTPSTGVVILATGLSNPNDIAVDDTSVYWTEYGSGTVKKVSKSGGTVTTLVSDLYSVSGLAADSNYVYFIENVGINAANIKRVSKNGGSVTTLASGQPSAWGVTVDSSSVYWTDGYGGTIRKVSINGGSVSILATGSNSPAGIAVDSINVYWSEFTNPGSVKKVSISGGSVTTLATNSNTPGIAVDGTNVYWTEYVYTNSGKVNKVSVNGGTVTSLATGLNSPWDVAVDSCNAFWVEFYSGGAAKQVSLGGGSITTLASGLAEPVAIAIDSTNVYWIERNGGAPGAGSVKSIAKGTCIPDTAPPIPGTVTPSNIQYGNFVDSPFDLTTSFTDNESTVTSCEYTTNGSTWLSATLSGSSPTWTCTKTGITGSNGQALTLNMRATSSGGTGTGTAITRTVDSAPPTTTDNSSSSWTSTSPVIVTLSPNDGSGSGAASTKYCVDTANTCTPATTGTSVEVSCPAGSQCIQYVRYYSVDNVGNQETIKASNQIRQDSNAPTGFKLISAGGDHTVALTSDGSLWSWGWNIHGELGDGTMTDRHSPVRIGSTNTNWATIAAGWGHTLALKADGTLWAWGDNGYGGLGDGTTNNRYTPMQMGTDTNWVSIAGGYGYTIALKSDGTLWAWGRNVFGELGDGTTTERHSPVQIGTDKDWVSISAMLHTVALKSNGTLWTWGWNIFGELGDGTTTDRHSPVQIGNDKDWVSIAAGATYTVALKSDASLWTWGWNSDGQLGDGTTTDRHSPVQIGNDKDWVSIAAGYAHTVSLKSDSTLWTWGDNSFGQLGDGTAIDKHSPMRVSPETNWISIATGDDYTVALKSDGTLWTWGRNAFGQLGDGTTTNKSNPTHITIDITPPNAPAVSGVSPINNQLPTWTWVSGGNGGNGTFRYKLDNSDLTIGATTTTTTTYTPAAALSAGTHTLYVQERDDAGNWSVSGSKTVLIDTTAPSDGTLIATAGDAQVSLSWSGFSDATSGIGSYRLVYSASGTPGSCSSGIQIYSGSGNSYTHSSLTNGTNYYYRVCAYDNAGNVSTGAMTSATTQAPISNITVDPPSLNFRSVNVGKSSIKAVTVSNIGTANLTVGTIEITGTNASEFSILNDTCSGQTVAPSGTCRVDVRFSPTSGIPARFSMVEYFKQAMSLLTPTGYKQTKSAILNIPSNDPDTPTLDVPLSGKGYATMMQRILDIQKVWQRSLFPSAGK